MGAIPQNVEQFLHSMNIIRPATYVSRVMFSPFNSYFISCLIADTVLQTILFADFLPYFYSVYFLLLNP